MGDTVIKVENISKLYRLGVVSGSTLKEDISFFFARMQGKEEEYYRVRENREKSNIFWALKDVNFDLKMGDMLGIIGKNGAGKSTLLKILSRVTAPTKGEIKIKGRVSSLLEVGTGFHPELTGRENVFLNGAILGMTKAEIKRKFDQILAFSGVEKYIDTPVKRYSSGMYVRLAFAVAAHLNPEILIVDEVLAVGDTEFQKKCIGKMRDVAKEGRTVIFVSHSMTAINSLCNVCIYLKSGKLNEMGFTDSVINKYMSSENTSVTEVVFQEGQLPGDDIAKLLSARLVDENRQKINYARIDRKIGIEFVYRVASEGYRPVPNIHIRTSRGEYAFVSSDMDDEKLSVPGIHRTVMWIPADFLNDGTYIADIALSTMVPLVGHLYKLEALVFDVVEDVNNRVVDYRQSIPGVLRPKFEWETTLIN